MRKAEKQVNLEGPPFNLEQDWRVLCPTPEDPKALINFAQFESWWKQRNDFDGQSPLKSARRRQILSENGSAEPLIVSATTDPHWHLHEAAQVSGRNVDSPTAGATTACGTSRLFHTPRPAPTPAPVRQEHLERRKRSA
jgi:hypothetical protein